MELVKSQCGLITMMPISNDHGVASHDPLDTLDRYLIIEPPHNMADGFSAREHFIDIRQSRIHRSNLERLIEHKTRIGNKSEDRREIEKFLEQPIYLDLHVKTKADWRNNKRTLSDFGYNF